MYMVFKSGTLAFKLSEASEITIGFCFEISEKTAGLLRTSADAYCSAHGECLHIDKTRAESFLIRSEACMIENALIGAILRNIS